MSPAERLAIELGAPLGDRDRTKLVPMLCDRDETGERVLGQPGWIFELKLDGVRILADKRKDKVSLGYRKLRNATESYPEIAEAVAQLGEERVLLDGEILAFDEEGRPDFQRLGTRIQSHGPRARRAAHRVPVAYVVFDVLVVGDRDVTSLPIEARKQILEAILGDTSKLGGHLRLHPTFADGRDLFRLCREHHLEGVVAKRAGSAYRPDVRSADWVKVKYELESDLVVVGWTEGEGKRWRLGALDVAAYDGDRLVVQGSVGSGLDEDTIDGLVDRLSALEVPKRVAEGRYSVKGGRHHVSPEIVISVRHVGITADGHMRFPVFRGLRDDLSPQDCTVAHARTRKRRARTTAPGAVVLLDGTTKGALCTYYEAVAPFMLPHLRGRICRPLRAAAAPGTVLWPLPEWTPSWIRTAAAVRGKDDVRGVIVEDLDTLLFLVEAGGASLQMTPVREATPRSADFIALRIEGAGAAAVAVRARELVVATGLTPFLMTSGLGLEVIVPIGEAPAEAAHFLAALFVRLLAAFAGEQGATVEHDDAPLAPYAVSVPSASGDEATASVPIAWDELGANFPAPPSLDRMRKRLAKAGAAPLRTMFDVTVDFTRAVQAIEAMVCTELVGGRGAR